VHEGLRVAGLPETGVQVIATTDRAAVGHLVAMEKYVDVIVPRGGKSLIERVAREAKVPVLKHLDGVCHVFIDALADPEQAIRIADNAKTQRYSPCNTMETLLVHAAIAEQVLPALAAIYAAKGVELRGCERSRSLVPSMTAATRTTGTRSTWRRFSRCASSTISTRRSTTSLSTARSTPMQS
jgi:glutamate-5-semialdehyde dehydrogenase